VPGWAIFFELTQQADLIMVASERVVARCAACAGRDQVIAELGRAVKELRAEVAEMRRRLGCSRQNSPMPPSSDDRPGPDTTAAGIAHWPRPEARGKQPGRRARR
jgi:hypothetical protein